jgi:hypothetical protein
MRERAGELPRIARRGDTSSCAVEIKKNATPTVAIGLCGKASQLPACKVAATARAYTKINATAMLWRRSEAQHPGTVWAD